MTVFLLIVVGLLLAVIAYQWMIIKTHKCSSAPSRLPLPEIHNSRRHPFQVAQFPGTILIGEYFDGQPGKVTVSIGRPGSWLYGAMDAFGRAVSLLLQYGVPFQVLIDEFKGMDFSPQGYTKNPEVRQTKSVVDYLFRWMDREYIDREARIARGEIYTNPLLEGEPKGESQEAISPDPEITSPPAGRKILPPPAIGEKRHCPDCEEEMVRSFAPGGVICFNCGRVPGQM